MADNTPGPESLLTNELTLQIRKLVLDNVKYVEIQQILGINENTWDAWVNKNYKDFRTNLSDWKKERMIKKAEKQVEVLAMSEDERVALDASKFLLETLGKDEYSKRTEQTGANGKPLSITFDQTFNANSPRQAETDSPVTSEIQNS